MILLMKTKLKIIEDKINSFEMITFNFESVP